MSPTHIDPVAKLSRSSDVPLWQQLESELRGRVQRGEFVDRFPSDRELMEVYGVSRHTARHAVSSLGRDGIVERSRGIGTSINAGRITQSLGHLYSLFQVVEAAGIEQTSVVLSIGSTIAEKIAQEFGLDEDAPLFQLARLRLAAGRPIAVDYAWLPGTYISHLEHADFTHTSLYDEMERSTLGRPTAGSEMISATVPSEDVRRLLEIDTQTGVFELIRRGERSGKIIEYRKTFVRGDDFTLVTDWQRGKRSEMRLEQNKPIADPIR
jgi:GntR family transcriptional regulator